MGKSNKQKHVLSGLAALLAAFLTTLDGGIAAPQNLLQPPFMSE